MLTGVVLSSSLLSPCSSHAISFGDQSGNTQATNASEKPADSISRKSDVSVFSFLEKSSGNVTTLVTGLGAVRVMSYGGSVYLAAGDSTRNRIDPYLLNVTFLRENGYLTTGDDRVDVIIESISPRDLAQAQLSVAGIGGTVHPMYSPHLPYLSAGIPYPSILSLASSAMVAKIWLRARVDVTLSESVPIIKDPAKWLSLEYQLGRGVNGTGVTVAVLDTGIDATHPDLVGRIISSTSLVPGELPDDGFGHGTHVASIVAGTGAASEGLYRGVAPGASILNVKVLSNEGFGYSDWIVSGIQWAVDNGADVLSMSFGSSMNGDGSDPISL